MNRVSFMDDSSIKNEVLIAEGSLITLQKFSYTRVCDSYDYNSAYSQNRALTNQVLL